MAADSRRKSKGHWTSDPLREGGWWSEIAEDLDRQQKRDRSLRRKLCYRCAAGLICKVIEPARGLGILQTHYVYQCNRCQEVVLVYVERSDAATLTSRELHGVEWECPYTIQNHNETCGECKLKESRIRRGLEPAGDP